MCYLFKAQCEDIVRRCESGFSAENALRSVGALAHEELSDLHQKGQQQKVTQGPKKSDAVSARKLDSGGLVAMKRDVEVLKQISDLRGATTAGDKPHQYSGHANADRKEARKALRRLATAESERDLAEESEQRDEEAAQEAMLELMALQASESSTPSLTPAIAFLMQEFVQRLVKECCQSCGENVFPACDKGKVSDPREHPALSKANHPKRPVRAYCGHWCHHKCIDKWLTTPPFTHNCPVCTRKISHPDWSDDVRALEKAWNTKQAASSEQDMLADMMGF